MNDETPIHELSIPMQDDGRYAMGPAVEPQAPPSGPAIAGRLLRGRWRTALGLSAVLAAAGIAMGLLIPKPLYKSVGLIDVAPQVPRVLYQSDEKGLLPMFENYIASQASLASTRRVVDMAMASPEWRKFDRGTSDDAVGRFQERLAVTHPKYTEHIEVAFTDENPDAAMVAVNQVIAAYMKIVDERENQADLQTRNVLENQRALAGNKLLDLRQDELVASEELGEQGVEERYKYQISELNKLDAVLHDLDVEIATGKAASQVQFVPGRAPSPQEIALKDAGMQDLLVQKSAAQKRVAYLRDTERLGAKHPTLVDAQDAVTAIDGAIAERSQAFMDALSTAPDRRGPELREKELRRTGISELRENVLAEAKKLSKKRMLLANIEQERGLQTERLDEVKKRIAQINVESEVHGRISVISYGDRPVEADTDRRIPFAALGTGGGLALGFGAVLLWGMCERKLRHVVDVDRAAARGRVLGVIPDVTEAIAPVGFENSAQMGDFCVHHVRTMLQIRGGERGGVLVLTSPSPGAGKTTLAFALGMSYAAAGSRTLLVDCDFVGRGLTSTLRALACKSAETVLAGGVEDPSAETSAKSDIVAGLVAARSAGYNDARAGELLSATWERARTGDAAAGRAARALAALARNKHEVPISKGRRGVVGALTGKPLGECIVETGVPGLDVLPVDANGLRDASCLSPKTVERLIEACREHYDTVLVDTGPVLGSIETAFATAVADQVVLIVSRGERGPRVQDAFARIQEINGDAILGVVFNRASTADVAQSSYASRPSVVAEAA